MYFIFFICFAFFSDYSESFYYSVIYLKSIGTPLRKLHIYIYIYIYIYIVFLKGYQYFYKNIYKPSKTISVPLNINALGKSTEVVVFPAKYA